MTDAATASRTAPGAGARAVGRTARQRVETVDSVRALALLGVVVINMQDLSGLTFMSKEVLAMGQSALDRFIAAVLDVLVEKKALSAFSFLFGLSFTLLLEGSRRRGEPFVPLYLRRLMFLGVFGVVNVAFFYWGDILTTYAVLGLVLLPALWLPQQLVLALAAGLTLGVPLALAAMGAVPGPGVPLGTDIQAFMAFGETSPGATVVHNVERFLAAVQAHSTLGGWNYSNIVGLFLLGLWAGRSGIARDLTGHAPLLKQVAVIALPLGLALSVLKALLPFASPWATAMLAGTPLLAVGYVAAAAVLLERSGARIVRDALAPAGKVALSLYLLSGLAGEAVFYGWGLSMMGALGSAGVLAVALGIYAGLLVLAHAWLWRFRYGPFEWLWRCLTHMRRQPLRR